MIIVIMMMTEMFLIADGQSSDNTTDANQGSGGKELRAYVNLRPLLCSESECVWGEGGGGGLLPTFQICKI